MARLSIDEVVHVTPDAGASGRPLPSRRNMLDADVLWALQERQRATVRLFARLGWADLSARRVLQVDCGDGGNLLELLSLGFLPRNLVGVEQREDRFARAMQLLPSGVTLMQGDASLVKLPDESEDIVMQHGVFSSLLDAPFQWRLAQTMWRWVRPGGGVLWYDCVVDDSRDPNRRGVPVARIRELFPQGLLQYRRVTLAQPLAGAACRVHPSLYTLLNLLMPLRTHVLAWIEKPVP